MDPKQMFAQMLDFNKRAFDNAFKAIVMVQDQNERMMNTFVEQAAWLPEEGKKTLNEWISSYKKGREDYRKAVEEGFKKVEEFFVTEEKAKSK